MQLPAIEGNVLGLRARGLEVDDAPGAVVEGESRVDLAHQRHTRGVAWNRERARADPAMAEGDTTRPQIRSYFFGPHQLVVVLRLAVEHREDLRKRRRRAPKHTVGLEPVAAPALLPQESEVAWSELDDAGGSDVGCHDRPSSTARNRAAEPP